MKLLHGILYMLLYEMIEITTMTHFTLIAEPNDYHNTLATSFIIIIFHGRVSTDHAPYKKDMLELKLEK